MFIINLMSSAVGVWAPNWTLRTDRAIYCLLFEFFIISVFSLNFSSAGKGPFMASKAKNMPQRCTFPRGEGGSGVRDMAPL